MKAFKIGLLNASLAFLNILNIVLLNSWMYNITKNMEATFWKMLGCLHFKSAFNCLVVKEYQKVILFKIQTVENGIQ